MDTTTNLDICGLYEYYKGGTYFVLGEAKVTETEQAVVIYKDVNQQWWVRSKKMFFGSVWVNGAELPRFRKIA
jgi:hypothetical protein